MKIIKFLLGPLFFRKDALYEFPGSVEDAVGRLSSSVKGNPFSTSLTPILYGTGLNGMVSETEVLLCWCRIFVVQGTDWFRPVFSGEFVSRAGKTVLQGEYALPLFVKVIVTIFVTALPAFVVYSFFAVDYWVGGFSAFAFLAVLAGLNLGWILRRDDVDDIDASIRGAINRPGA